MSDIRINLPLDYAQLLVMALDNYKSSSVEDLRRMTEMVETLENQISRAWHEDHDQNAKCKCGHQYHRHFDGYEDMASVGCKYCECYTFTATAV
jgi:hypothetical protein